jgi:hypothetical protein
MRITTSLLTLAVAGGVAACKTPGRVATWEQAPVVAAAGTSTSSAASDVALAEAAAAWSKRDEEASLRQAIAAWEKVLATDANHLEAHTMLARAHYFLADGFLALQADKEEEELATYQKGVDHGERALLLAQPAIEAKVKGGAKLAEAVGAMEAPGLRPAYWYSVNLGRFATKKGLSVRLYYKDQLKATMERVLALDPAFFHGAADRYFGAFYAVLPSIAGKDLDRSGKHFEASLQQAPGYLGTKVVQAQFLAVERDDEAMYRALLEEVIAAPDGDDADIAPENRAAKRHARKMLAGIGDLF